MAADLSLGDPEPCEVLGQVAQIMLVRVGVFSSPSFSLQVDVVPGDAVVLPGGDAPPHSEEQPLLPGQVEPVQGLEPLLIIREESCPGESYRVVILARVWVLLSLYTRGEHEGHLYGVTPTVSWQWCVEYPV